jgi:hypothetical protein
MRTVDFDSIYLSYASQKSAALKKRVELVN